MHVTVEVQVRRSEYTVSAIGTFQITIQCGIRALPDARPRIIIPRTEVVEACLLIQLLRREEIRRALGVRVFFDPGLAEGEVFQVLEDFAVEVGHIARRAKVVRVVVVLVLLEDLGGAGGVAVAIPVPSGVTVANPVGVALAAVAVGPAPGFGAGVRDIVGDVVAIDIDDVRGLYQLRHQPGAAGEDVLGADLAAPHG